MECRASPRVQPHDEQRHERNENDGGRRDQGDPIPWALLHDLGQLIDCDLTSVNGQDTPRWEFFAEQEVAEIRCSAGSRIISAEQTTAFDAAYRQHYWASACSYPDRSRDIESVTRQSDLQTAREHRSSGMYLDYIQPIGLEREMMVCLDASAPQRTLRLLFSRALTVRQQEILNHVAAAYTNSQIARRLDVSSATVRKHLENIFARLEVTSRTAAVARADLLV